MPGLGSPLAQGKGIGPDEARASAGFGSCNFSPLWGGFGHEKIATTIDPIDFCTACHAEGRGFEPVASAIAVAEFSYAILGWLTVVATFCPCFVHALACGALSRIARRLDVDRHIGSVLPIG
jgi:hypothetical protein